ncbi:thiamine phosphate synthase [Corynebacterium phoceense]|uniref:thiamine phosphate synthase n=1 Tax=Corynebacterium phoceense TaxID=1686286 RepID=UPI00211C432E|nr:thiamine phosphate synthase [Corynebacterium phoceense]MCQ9330685.1 thiamine phosphate synthase [Corynebacterium phoceense]MCQ9347080.1 thiamine phosphate synthase [Corynebacterium phoceense]
MRADLRCYFVTGSEPSDALARRAAAAASGGAGVIQVRSKPISARDLYDLGAAVSTAVHAANPGTAVVIDDRVDVALALREAGFPVAGVHLGQDDLSVRAARELLGPDALIGLTTGTLPLIEDANQYADVLDYVGCGPFRATPTKDSGRPPLGLEGYPAIVATGVAGVAVVRGIMHADDPAAYCTRIRAAFEERA